MSVYGAYLQRWNHTTRSMYLYDMDITVDRRSVLRSKGARISITPENETHSDLPLVTSPRSSLKVIQVWLEMYGRSR